MSLDAVEVEAHGTLYVDRSDAERGSKEPFYAVYRSEDADDRVGYLCGNCETLDNAMGTSGRIECNVCGNIRKPDEWDDAHE